MNKLKIVFFIFLFVVFFFWVKFNVVLFFIIKKMDVFFDISVYFINIGNINFMLLEYNLFNY